MPSIIIIDKSGSVKSTNVRALDMSELYKKCGFKTASGFELHHTWPIEFNNVEYKLQVYGKTDGKANTENKYEFPPPIDKTLFFGSCVVLNVENDIVSNMSSQEFNAIMDYLQGGYSDIGESEEEKSSEEDVGPVTKQGYKKDGFVVEDDEDEDSDDSDYSSSNKKKVSSIFASTTELSLSADKAPTPTKKAAVKKVSTGKAVVDKSPTIETCEVAIKPSICIKKPTKPRARKEKVEEPDTNYCSENVTCELVEEEYLERI